LRNATVHCDACVASDATSAEKAVNELFGAAMKGLRAFHFPLEHAHYPDRGQLPGWLVQLIPVMGGLDPHIHHFGLG
jgi:hypothetical protein